MKTVISNLKEALAFVLNDLYSAEGILRDAIPGCLDFLSADSLRSELLRYSEQAGDKLTKLHRAFGYLTCEPDNRKNMVVQAFAEKTKQTMQLSTTPEIRNLMLATCFQSVNYYKIANYRAAARFACELELEVPATLIEEILGWERTTAENLQRIATYEISGTLPEYSAKPS